ncbi:MAG: GTP 3',8-cyclase MoaA [Thermoplasmata archaeon]|nr:GTP 3',8-cyclase MoaA [Thermoplasmata archaeon]
MVEPIKDKYGRPVESIRISVTERCNLNCIYCHNEGQMEAKTEMRAEEIEKILEIASRIGIKDVKFTGGEPLMRKDILDIIRAGRKYMEDVSMTTNGTLLAPVALKLKEAGLNRVNISMDSVERERYRKITGKDMVDRVKDAIKASVEAGLYPVKVNIVAFPDSFDDIFKTIEFVWSVNAMPQIIEAINVGRNKKLYAIDEIEKRIASMAVDVRVRKLHKRKIYSIVYDGKIREVEIVRPMHNSEFCANCNRIRLTSDGMLKPCIMHNRGLVDILTPLREGATDDELIALFKKAIMNRFPYWR